MEAARQRPKTAARTYISLSPKREEANQACVMSTSLFLASQTGAQYFAAWAGSPSDSVATRGACPAYGSTADEPTTQKPSALVLGRINQLVLGNPGHHGAQLGAHFLDRMGIAHGAGGLEAGLAGLVFQNPVAGEFAGLDVLQNLAHLRLGLIGDDARAGDIFAIFRGVGDGIVHIGDAAFI